MDTRTLDAQIKTLVDEKADITAAIQLLVNENASTAISQEEYQRRYNAIASKYETAEQRLADIAVQKRERAMRREKMAVFMQQLAENSDFITEFDEELWNTVVKRVVVRLAEKVIFILRHEVEWAIE